LNPRSHAFNLKKILSLIGINRTVAALLTGKLWSIFSYPLTIWFIIHHLNPGEQGYYYAFYSLLGLDIFLELGLTSVLTTIASHEWPKLEMDSRGRLSGDPEAKAKVLSLAKFFLRWYSVASVVHLLLLGGAGIWFFGSKPNQSVYWLVPWLLTVLINSLRLVLIPIGGLLQGCGQMASIAWMQARAVLIPTFVLWVGLNLNWSLYVVPVVALIGLLILCFTYFYKYKYFTLEALRIREISEIHWKTEVFPLQWRIALSWASGYFIFQFQIPVIFHFCGDVEAGRYGLTLSVLGSIGSLSMAWVSSRVADFGAMIASKKTADLYKIARRCQIQALSVLLLGFAALFGALALMEVFLPERRFRFASNNVLIGVMLYQAINTVIGIQALVVRAHKVEPYARLSLYGAAAIALLVPPAALYLGVPGAAWTSFLIAAALFVPSLRIYQNYRKLELEQ